MPSTTQVRTLVIPAAGLGTRFLPVTKAVPKELLPIGDMPAIQLVIDEALAAGIEHVVRTDATGSLGRRLCSAIERST